MLVPVVQSDVEDKLEDVDDLELRVHDQSVLLFHRYRQRLASLAVGGCSTATVTTNETPLLSSRDFIKKMEFQISRLYTDRIQDYWGLFKIHISH